MTGTIFEHNEIPLDQPQHVELHIMTPEGNIVTVRVEGFVDITQAVMVLAKTGSKECLNQIIDGWFGEDGDDDLAHG